jgi:hypothetical protein
VLASILTACGGSSTPATPTVVAGLDPCTVGSWKSTGVHGTVSSNDGSIRIPLSGGAGDGAVIRRDGTVALDYSSAEPQQGTGTDGGHYSITVTGHLTGRLRAAGGVATLDVGDPSTATQTISKDGVVLQRVNPPPEQVSTYTCKAGSALAVTTNGITVDWAPAGS